LSMMAVAFWKQGRSMAAPPSSTCGRTTSRDMGPEKPRAAAMGSQADRDSGDASSVSAKRRVRSGASCAASAAPMRWCSM
jgi:hypothetical protein